MHATTSHSDSITQRPWFAPLALLGLLLITGCGLVGNDDKKPRLPGTIVFSAMDESGEYQIYTMRPDGSRLKRLTDPDFEYGLGEHDIPFHGLNPAWSPDGSRIVFETFYKATSIGPSLWVMNADGSDPRPLYDPEPDNIHVPVLMGNNPRWSPDGTKVAFYMCVNCSVSTQYLIFVFDTVSKELTQLSEFPAQDMYPSWSPDGTKIAFVSNRDYISGDTDRFRQELYIMDADGSNQTRITETGFPGIPIWHPDGNSVIFISSNSSYPELYKVEIDTRISYKILEASLGIPGPQPHAWSADDHYLLVSTLRRTFPFSHTLYSLDTNTGELTVITTKYSDNSNQAIMGSDWK